MKKLVSLLLVLAILISAMPVVFAAGSDDYFDVSFDNQAPSAGGEVTATISLKKQISGVSTVVLDFSYNKDYLTCTGVAFSGTTLDYDTTEVQSGEYLSYVEFAALDDDAAAIYQALPVGYTIKLTFKVADDAAGEALNFKLNYVTYDTDYNEYSEENSYSMTVAGTLQIKPTATGYSVSMGADQQVAAGQQVRIPVTVASSEKGITGFNAYDMTFTYDPAALTLNTKTGDAANLTVEDNNGTVRVRRYGAIVPLGEALALDFTAKKAGTSTVTLTAAKFDLDANSINFDAPPATITDSDTNVKGLWTVTLPDGFVSAATDKSTLVEDGADFTFKPVDTNYEYTLTITTNGKTDEVTVKGSSYTIANITDNVQVTQVSRVGKTYTVKIEGSGADLVTGAAATAQFPNDYTFTVKAPGTGYRTTVAISNRGTYLTKNKFTTERQVNGDDVYTILGDSLAGDENNVITITVEKVENTIIKNIIVEGNGSEAFSPDNDMTFHYDENYTFRLNLDTAHYTYVIRAKYYRDNAPVMMNVIDNGDGTYTVLSPLALDLHIVIEKFAKALDPNAVDVSKYLELDNKTIFIVSVYGTLQNKNADGTYSYIAYTYDGHLMYNTSYYVDPANDSKGASSWLVMVDRGETFTKEDALAKLAFQDSDKEQYDSISMTYWGKILENVNGSPSSNWDVNDSQFVYDLYNGVYDSFEKVSIKQFLLADQSQDRLLNSADAVTMTKRYNW